MMPAIFSYLSWVASPLIANAPMGGFAGGQLASAVSIAGGLGFIGSINNMTDLRENLRIASEAFAATPVPNHNESTGTLPVGVGLLPFVLTINDTMPVLREYSPAIVWLFSPKSEDDYAAWTAAIRVASPKSKVWIAVGSVSSAVHVAKTAKPDAICLQGSDAGGHGYERGASIISLLPEAIDTFEQEGLSHIALLASGGIVDGRGAASALALGAQGVIMGTRYLASEEVIVHPTYQAAILEARDGSQVTVRSKLFDELNGPSIWPKYIDGRSLTVQSYVDYENGVALEEIQRLHKEAIAGPDKGFATGRRGRAAIWAGSGVGLVNEVESAANITKTVRAETKAVLKKIYKQYGDC